MSKQRVVLVTGGMGGLGETISTRMADAGYRGRRRFTGLGLRPLRVRAMLRGTQSKIMR